MFLQLCLSCSIEFGETMTNNTYQQRQISSSIYFLDNLGERYNMATMDNYVQRQISHNNEFLHIGPNMLEKLVYVERNMLERPITYIP